MEKEVVINNVASGTTSAYTLEMDENSLNKPWGEQYHYNLATIRFKHCCTATSYFTEFVVRHLSIKAL